MIFFRIQHAGYTLSQMQSHNSADGGDGFSEGLCVSDTPDQFGGAWDAYNADNGEVLVLRGDVIQEIYDGYRIFPTKIVARFLKSEWALKLKDETAWDYEEW